MSDLCALEAQAVTTVVEELRGKPRSPREIERLLAQRGVYTNSAKSAIGIALMQEEKQNPPEDYDWTWLFDPQRKG